MFSNLIRTLGARPVAPQLVTVIFLSVLTFVFAFARAETNAVPAWGEGRLNGGTKHFDAAEAYSYQARWNGIPVATAEVQGAPRWIEGKKFYHVEIQAKTMSVLDYLWRMRDTIVSTFDPKTLQPHRFVFLQRENRRNTDTTAVFDQDKNKWFVQRQKGSKIDRFDFTSTSTLDPITAVYILRRIDFKVGDRLQFDVFGGKSRYLLTFDIAGRERITLNTGSVDTYKIIPQIRNVTKEGYAERMRQATVWVSADEKRIPVRMVSKVFVGNVNLELVKESPVLKKASAAKPEKDS